MKETISKILNLAICAPSGDNCQPWAFTSTDKSLQIYNCPEKDTSLYNYKQRASMLAHGALLENISVIAPSHGYDAVIKYFPDSTNSNCVAEIHFKKCETVEHHLLQWIKHRCTNRKKFTTIPLTDLQIDNLMHASEMIPDTKIIIKNKKSEISQLAKLLSNNDRMVFENTDLHQFLFEQIRWTEKEAKQSNDGMDVKTFELNLIDSLAFKFFKNRLIVEILNTFGLSKIVSLNAQKLIKASAGIVALTTKDLNDLSLVKTGRTMQRFWLEATALGLSVQPIAGLAFLIQRLRSGETAKISPNHQQQILKIATELDCSFQLKGDSAVMFFRIGTSAPPSARSLRKAVNIN